MKIISVKSILILLLLASCASFTDDLDTDPNRLADVDAMDIIQGPMIFDQFFHTGQVARQPACWINQFRGAERSIITSLRSWFLHTSYESNEPWSLAYYGVAQCRIIVKKAEEDNPALSGAAKILEAHMMGSVTSLWGDVPFSQACNDQIRQPTFDSQESVYEGIQLLLDESIANLSNGGSIAASKDLFYSGNLSKWIKLAYSLKARYFLHTGDFASAKINALLGISSFDGDMIADYGGIYQQNMNPFYSYLVYDRPGYIGARDAYTPTIMDPDANFPNTYDSYTRNHAKHFEGDRFYYNYTNREYYTAGYEPNWLNGFDWDCQDCGKFGEDMPLVTYGEMLLIISECEARLNGLAAGVTAYNSYRQLINTGYGFTNNLENVGWDFQDYVDANFSPGGLEDPLSTSSAPVFALLREIYEERYVYFIGNIEAFTDLRRTGNLAEIQLENFGGIPQRLLYPESEINSNRNVPNPLPDVLTPTWVHE